MGVLQLTKIGKGITRIAVVQLVFTIATLACGAVNQHLVTVSSRSTSVMVEALKSGHVPYETRTTALLYDIEGGVRDPWKSGCSTISMRSFSRTACDVVEGSS